MSKLGILLERYQKRIKVMSNALRKSFKDNGIVEQSTGIRKVKRKN